MIALTLLKSGGDGGPAQTVKEFPAEVHEGEMLWVDAESPTEQELADLKSRFGLDDYAVEDVVHKNQRPKLEEYGKWGLRSNPCARGREPEEWDN